MNVTKRQKILFFFLSVFVIAMLAVGALLMEANLSLALAIFVLALLAAGAGFIARGRILRGN